MLPIHCSPSHPPQLERGLADFWQGVAAAAPQVHARLQRASTVCEGLAAEVQDAIADKWVLAVPGVGSWHTGCA